MKNAIRARRNGGKTANSPQAKTRIPEPGISRIGSFAGDQPIALTVFSHKKDKMLAGCDISHAAWDRLQQIAHDASMPVGALLENIVQGMLVAHRPGDLPFRPVVVDGNAILDFEIAKQQSHALHHLLNDAFTEQSRNGQYCGEVLVGIINLIGDTHAKMNKVYEALANARKVQMAIAGAMKLAADNH